MFEAQHKDLSLYARGLREWLRGEDTEDAEAAGRNVANVLSMLRDFMSED